MRRGIAFPRHGAIVEAVNMRITLATLLVCLAASVALGDDEARRAQVNAATSDAFQSLRHEVLSMPINGELTVEGLLRECNSSEQFDATLHSAEQIGGARWLDDQTTQVRLEIRGEDIARALERIAERNSKVIPTSTHALRDRLKKIFSDRTFAATGTSTAGSVAERLKPDASQTAWRNVSDVNRRAAIDAARSNAINRVLDSLGPGRNADAENEILCDQERRWGSQHARAIVMTTTIYGIKNCDTMKKARAWLDGHGVAYEFHDYKTAGIAKDKLKALERRRSAGRRCSTAPAPRSASCPRPTRKA